MYFFSFIYTVFSKAFYIINTRKKETKWAINYLREIEEKYKGRFDDLTFKKIYNSYAIYNPMMCDAFTLLHKRVTNREERKRLLHYFICSSVMDNFFDRKELTNEELLQISFSPDSYIPKNFDERIFLDSHLLLKDFIKDKSYYDEVTHLLFNAQADSLKQFDTNISTDEIERITFSKGGNSVLLCHFYLDIDATKTEQQCWYQIGSIIQLTNDLFDVYKDIQDGSNTLPLRTNNAYGFDIFFNNLITDIQQQIQALPFQKKVKQSFSISMMGICAFGLIAIENLKRIQGNATTLPDLKTLPRKELIIDMEKKSLLWRWIQLVYKYAKL
jgi:hypothetical protein